MTDLRQGVSDPVHRVLDLLDDRRAVWVTRDPGNLIATAVAHANMSFGSDGLSDLPPPCRAASRASLEMAAAQLLCLIERLAA